MTKTEAVEVLRIYGICPVHFSELAAGKLFPYTQFCPQCEDKVTSYREERIAEAIEVLRNCEGKRKLAR